MTDEEMANRFLFGGRVTYQDEHYHVLEVNHLNNTYTLKPDHNGVNITGVKASECKPYDYELKRGQEQWQKR